MRNTSETWKSLAAGDGTHVESRAIINNVQYSDIEPPTITRALMQNGLEVGNVVSAMCSFILDTADVIPKSAEVQIASRLVGGTDDAPIYSEWLQQGTFYISKRVRDPLTGIRQFECYDALLKTNAVWEPASSAWPQQTEDILDEILLVIGLELDARTSITSYPISQPNAGTTMRDVLSVIAQHNGGNWIVTPDNKLRLVPIQDLNDAGEDVVEIESVIDEYYTGEINEISGIRVVSEDGDSLIGDETGAVVSVTIPEMIAVDLAEELIGKTYRPFSFGNAGYDIAAELGDYIQCEDAVSVIYAETVTLGTGMHGDISAPDLAEIADEYPYVGSSNKTLVAAKAYAVVVADAARDAAIDAAAAELAEAVVDINSDIDDLQSQIDGNITTWFYAVNPTLNNPPANAWTTDAEKNNHLGDLYYNTENGYCWRFMLANGRYSWQRISDTDITTALANAQRAQDTADGKRRVFVVQPTPPYDVGDLWVQGTSGDIMRCSTAKVTGAAYSQSDWVRASKYTDDTAVNTLNNALTQQEIFNRLTDNGAAQGMVLYNGQLYVNASYINAGFLSAARIKGDILTLGGANNVNGTMRVLDAGGNVVVTINNEGADITDGNVVAYSEDRLQRVLLADGIVTFQRYNDESQPIGWRDVFKLTVDDSGDAQIGTYVGGGDLDIHGRGRVYLSNKADTLDDANAEIDMDDDSIAMRVTSGTGVIEGASLRLAPDSFRMSYRDPLTSDTYDVFEFVPGGASATPLPIGNGGTGASSAARARATLGITPANIGAVSKSGDTMTGNLNITKASAVVSVTDSTKGHTLQLGSWNNGTQGLWSLGYHDGSDYVSSPAWLIERDTTGDVIVAGTTGFLTVKNQSTTVPLQLGSWNNGTQGLWSLGYYNGSSYVAEAKWLIYRNTAGDIVIPGNANTRANLGTYMYLSDATPATVYAMLSALNNDETVNIAMSQAVTNYLTGAKVNIYLTGQVRKGNATQYRFMGYRSDGKKMYIWQADVTANGVSNVNCCEYSGTSI